MGGKTGRSRGVWGVGGGEGGSNSKAIYWQSSMTRTHGKRFCCVYRGHKIFLTLEHQRWNKNIYKNNLKRKGGGVFLLLLLHFQD